MYAKGGTAQAMLLSTILTSTFTTSSGSRLAELATLRPHAGGAAKQPWANGLEMPSSGGVRSRIGSVKNSASMNGSWASVVASEVGSDPVDACMRAPGSEIEHRVDRARQLVARQRELVARVGEQIPNATALLKTFETTLALFEKAQAALQRSQTLRTEQAVHSDGTVTAAPVPDCPEPGDAIRVKPDYEEQMSAVARILEILREGGYHCELDCAIWH